MNSEIVLERNKQRKRRKKTKKRNFKIFCILTGVIGIIFCIQGTVVYYGLKIYPKVWIDDVNVGGKTKEEAKEAIIEKHNALVTEKIINIKVIDKNYEIDTSKLNMAYDYDEVINEAFEEGKNSDILKKYNYIIFPEKKDFKLKHTYNYEAVDSIIKKIEEENNKKPINATISKISSNGIIVNNESYGYEVDSQKLRQDIQSKLDDIEEEENLLIQTEVNEIEPKVKVSDLKNIDSKITSFTTNFMSSNENRSTNISIAANVINGKLLMPGDIFSFNDVVGERSAERGYKMAKVIANDKLVDDLGGGICQVSTTLYNAILRANIPSVERYHHTLPSTYIGLGMDATVAYGLLDYKFKNTLPYPIFIESVIKDKNITFNIYSNSSLTNRQYDIVNEVVDDKVNVFKVTNEQGKIISRELLYTDKVPENKE